MKKQNSKQLSLFTKDKKRFFGGRLLYKKRKSRRPFSSKHSMHLVFRSRWARGKNSFLNRRNKVIIENIIHNTAKKYAVQVYQKAVVGNHLHLVVLCSNKLKYHAFVSVVSGRIASHIMGYLSYKDFKKNLSLDSRSFTAGGGIETNKKELSGIGQQFWDFRPFSRVLYWGKDFKKCCAYVRQNVLEALGFIDYKPRKNYYAKLISVPLTI